ncbi:hypothetical protein AB0O28_36160 [Microbispora sp. NPDC088329]|uniref:hypothetical protein n=1 Tax=Microbispora sp. NPDC088329 TaxID=3154869 RepID=UPI0034161BF4
MTEEPRLSAREMIERLEPALSRARRVRAVTSLLSGLSGTAFMTALWGGEPGPLPGGTQVVFALLIVACLAWAGYGGWLLMCRVPLFATDRVVAAWIALASSLATTAVLATLAVRRGTGAPSARQDGAARGDPGRRRSPRRVRSCRRSEHRAELKVSAPRHALGRPDLAGTAPSPERAWTAPPRVRTIRAGALPRSSRPFPGRPRTAGAGPSSYPRGT